MKSKTARKHRTAPRSAPKSGGSDAAERGAPRAWLREHGHQVGGWGRISAKLMELFRNK